MQMRLETITPRKAAEWLKLNINNRPLSEKFIRELAEIIADGQWQVNGDPIRFDQSGNLTDGQHRLTAILKAGTPVQSWVLRGLEASAFDSIDRGHKRTNGDILARRGEINYNMIAAAVNNIWSYFSDYGFIGRKLRPDQMDKILDEYGDLIRSACRFCNHHRSKLIPTGELACLVAIVNKLYGDGTGEAFWEKVLSAEGLVRGSAQHLLFRRLTDFVSGPTEIKKIARLAICVKAFNAWATGTAIKCLKFDEREEFPKFVEFKRMKRNA